MEGVLLTPLKRIAAPGGAVMHALKRSAAGYVDFGEAYFSEVHQGAIKSWRRHKRVTLNLVVVRGQVRFVLHAEKAKREACFREFSIGESNYARLTVPPGIWMAFQGVGAGASLIFDIIDEEYDPMEAETKDLAAIPFSW